MLRPLPEQEKAAPQTTETRSTAKTFWVFWSAQATSSVGTAVTTVALPLLAVTTLQVTSIQMGLISGAADLAWLLLGLPAGVLVQRLPLRGAQVAMDLLRAAVLLLLPLAWLVGLLQWWHLVVAALLISAANVIFDVSNSTFMATVIPKQELQRRNSLVSATEATTMLGGPTLGGALVTALGPPLALLADVLSFVASSVLLRTLPRRRIEQPEETVPMGRMIADGWRFVVRHPTIGPLTGSAAAVNLVAGMHMTLVPLFLVRELGASPWLVGLLLAAEGAGALVGASLTPLLTRRWGTARATVVLGVSGALGCVLLATGVGIAGYVLFAVGSLIFSFGVVVLSITARTNRQVGSPLELLPRVMATVRFVSWGIIPVGAVGAGFAATLLGTRETLIAAGVVALLSPVFILVSRIRWNRDLADVTVEAVLRDHDHA